MPRPPGISTRTPTPRSPSVRGRWRSRARSALTTVEVLVAIMLLGTAVLSTLSVHGAVTHLSARAHQRRQLAIAAGSALDSLRTIPCAAALPGAVSTPWGHIAWSVITRGASRTLRLVATPLAGFPWRAETAIPCA